MTTHYSNTKVSATARNKSLPTLKSALQWQSVKPKVRYKVAVSLFVSKSRNFIMKRLPVYR